LTKEFNGVSLHAPSTKLWIEDRGIKLDSKEICSGKRIGVEKCW
jgi:hypothetical protein